MNNTRPAWLQPYALVTGTILSAPLDLPQRMDGVYRRLQNALTHAVFASALGYSPIGAWLGELVDHVVVPTANDVRRAGQKASTTIVWWVVGGLAAFVLIARATAPAVDAYARLAANLRGDKL